VRPGFVHENGFWPTFRKRAAEVFHRQADQGALDDGEFALVADPQAAGGEPGWMRSQARTSRSPGRCARDLTLDLLFLVQEAVVVHPGVVEDLGQVALFMNAEPEPPASKGRETHRVLWRQTEDRS
jgi:hypothetical protein